MTVYGLTTTGFVDKPLDVIKAEMAADVIAKVSPNEDTSTTSPIGQLIGIFAGKAREVWELAQAVYAAQYPDSAEGFSLAALGVLTGSQVKAATQSKVLATVNVAPGTYIPGALVANVLNDANARFTNLNAVVNGGGGAADVDAIFVAIDTGPTRANSGTLTVISGAVAGWNSVTNALDATLGTDIETDAAFRVRREEELAKQGSATARAVAVDILDVADVLSVTVLENDTDTTDGNSVPPHSLEAIVLGGVSQAVADAIFASKGGGVGTNGSVVESVTGADGQPHTVKFSRPVDVLIYLDISITGLTASYPGDTIVKEALVDFAVARLLTGRDVVKYQLAQVIMDLGGMVDITTFKLGTAPSPGGTANIVIAVRELSRFDTSRIAITSTLVDQEP